MSEEITPGPGESPPQPLEQDAEKQSPESLPTTSAPESAFKSLGWLDQFLAVWILLAMIIGIVLGNFKKDTGAALQRGQFVGVSIPIGIYSPSAHLPFNVTDIKVAVGLLVMMYPILCKIRFETLHRSFKDRKLWIQVAFSILLNWIVAPFMMVRFYSSLVFSLPKTDL